MANEVVYTTLRAYNKKLFFPERHIKRLLDSAERAKIIHSESPREILKKCVSVVSENPFGNAVLRIELSATGLSVSVKKLEKFPDEIYSAGVKVSVVNYERPSPDAKLNNNFLKQIVEKKKTEGFFETLLMDRSGFVTEGASSNFFMVKNNELITPEEKILRGITRGIIIELAEEEMNVVHRRIKKEELFEADEIFITGTVKEVVPVIEVDGHKIGLGLPGNVSKLLLKKFRKFAFSF
ncbi:MAG: hypothetical protein COV47_01545 [Candidatus Diapherotrites archaeon CG11_big_fil_rev_8_21_14_0_20_37_9]|nr:MAG: hypothetical protein COV47_01545 [Candidatus Diapherotrites archaeon CG11_big_fil_rev_8_21_14_0_20_37_9]